MKIVAFSDIHGNQYAFQAFLNALKEMTYDAVFFCGDIHGYYYGQTAIVKAMKQMENLYAVKGNHDEFAIRVLEEIDRAEMYIPRYGNSYAMLEKENVDYVKALPDIIEGVWGGKRIAILHGCLDDVLEGRLYPQDELRETELYQKYDYVFCGHTHFQMVRKAGKTTIINAGSLGQQRDGKGFCYVVADTETGEIEYRTIKYDMTALEQEIRKHDPDNEKMIQILHRGER
ncbi:MAG: metallophosphoesterase family protein [Lachnospiraceae bacterium]|nr:metallophosphoesterase family protein [Lachnospiraceae bacterium]